MAAASCCVICYDVPDDRRRRRLSQTLDGYGWRVQYSVYEALLDRVLFDKLLQNLQSLLDPTADRVVVYTLCAGCAPGRMALGQAAADWARPASAYVV